jgi:hypothetical protein
MPIVTLQRTLREIGRIRIGQKSDKGYPTKLDRFRFTSSDPTVVEAAAQLYGGTPGRWAGAPIGEQWEVVTNSNQLTVIIPPGSAALSQWFELWSGGGAVRRCDGITEVIGDQPCLCNDEDQKQCKATTRLSLILSDLPGLGVWRLESKGYYAATELAGTVDICQQAAGQGQMLPAVLGLQARQVKRDGKTHNFVVPTLDVKVTPNRLASSLSTGNWQAIAAPDVEEPKAISAGDMEAAINPEPPAPKKTRANAQPPIPATGLKPRAPAIVDIEVNETRKEAVANGDDPNAAVLELRYTNRSKALTEARRVAKEKGWDMPSVFGDILTNAELVAELLA